MPRAPNPPYAPGAGVAESANGGAASFPSGELGNQSGQGTGIGRGLVDGFNKALERARENVLESNSDAGSDSGSSGNDSSGAGGSSSQPPEDPKKSGNRTTPTGSPGGTPHGERTDIPLRAHRNTQRSLQRENESADTLAREGYRVRQNPGELPNGKKPDYEIEGRVFDNYAPTSQNPSRIRDSIKSKVEEGQTNRIILNLDDSSVNISVLRTYMTRHPIDGLEEVLVIQNGQVTSLYP